MANRREQGGAQGRGMLLPLRLGGLGGHPLLAQRQQGLPGGGFQDQLIGRRHGPADQGEPGIVGHGDIGIGRPRTQTRLGSGGGG
jgi:hypothetical protein